MQPLLHCLDVTFRNAIDYAICHNTEPEATGLWRTDASWIYNLPRYIGDNTYIRQGKRFIIDRRGNPRTFPDGSSMYHFTAGGRDLECLNEHRFSEILHARKTINDWRQNYNECRPHSSLDYQTPAEFATDWRNRKYQEKPTDITNSRLYLILGASHLA